MSSNETSGVPPSLAEAFAHCIGLARDHYENFPVGSWLLPRALRPHVCSIYAFARIADDFADEPGLEPNERLRRLDGWEARLRSCESDPDGPVFVALGETIRRYRIPLELFTDLLAAFRSDVTTPRHGSFGDLLAYCRCSAVPVGRLVLHLFGYRDAERCRLSDAICTALQLANFWQDISVDFGRGRIYLPQEEMERFGVSEADLAQHRVSAGFRDLLGFQIDRTAGLFREGRALPDRVSGRLRLELKLTWLGGMEVLRKIPAAGYDVFQNRPRITASDTVRLLLRALFGWRSAAVHGPTPQPTLTAQPVATPDAHGPR
jgi:squalene synthase HpnC